MPSVGVYRVKDKKCATCSYWAGDRTIEFGGYQPRYIRANSGQYACLVQKSRTMTAAGKCPRHRFWEKL
jgi:hypothetical protein